MIRLSIINWTLIIHWLIWHKGNAKSKIHSWTACFRSEQLWTWGRFWLGHRASSRRVQFLLYRRTGRIVRKSVVPKNSIGFENFNHYIFTSDRIFTPSSIGARNSLVQILLIDIRISIRRFLVIEKTNTKKSSI